MILRRPELRATLTPALVRDIARKYVNDSRYVQVRLLQVILILTYGVRQQLHSVLLFQQVELIL